MEYTKQDFHAMEFELNKYAVEREQMVNGDKRMVRFVPVEGEQQWYIDQGALADKEEWTVKDINLFEVAKDKFNQYNKWKSRKEYAIKMQNKDLEKQAEEITNNMQII